MENVKNHIDKIKKENTRITKSRKAMLEILLHKYLTFKELQVALVKKGFHNVSTIYNNLEFFIEQKIILELYINETKYYTLATAEDNHLKTNYIHLYIKETNEIIEVSNPTIIDYLKKHSEFKGLNLESVRIQITASKTK